MKETTFGSSAAEILKNTAGIYKFDTKGKQTGSK
jgi:hypothetical protein